MIERKREREGVGKESKRVKHRGRKGERGRGRRPEREGVRGRRHR